MELFGTMVQRVTPTCERKENSRKMSKGRCGLWFIMLTSMLFCVQAAHAETWYVRANGGTRTQCDGRSDAAYPAKGKHCAFGDMRFLWDGREYGKLRWVIAGGDTVILDNTKAWRIGWEGDGTHRESEPWCWGWAGGPFGCFNPAIPAGTPEHHTRILGRNWEHCSAGSQPDKSKMTEVFGGHGAGTALNLSGAQYTDVECINIARHSDCARHGDPRLPKDCRNDPPMDDYDSEGITTDNHTHDVLLQDLWIHGHTDRGIIGPIGGLVTANRVDISTNGMAGWDFDDGRGTPSINGVLHMADSTIEWSGCNQQYPATSPIPVATCYGQSNGGYGDGIGTPANYGMDVVIDHSVFRYNVQDGEDFGHVDSGDHKLSITNSLSYANGGGQFKWGPNFLHVLFANNVAVGNCLRMSKPIPGVPASFNAHLGDFCRAEDAISFNFRQGGTAIFDNNTIVSYAPTTFDISCWDKSCSNSTLVLRNNIIMGVTNPATFSLGGKLGGPGGLYFQQTIGHVVRGHNLIYGVRNMRCESSEVCKDPRFANETQFHSEADLDNFKPDLAPNSPARGVGEHLGDLKTDFYGRSRPAVGAYTIGAVQ